MPVLGFVDLHNHQFAHLGFGGREFFGEPQGLIDQALPWCTPVHGAGGLLDPIGQFMHWSYGGGGVGHKVGGYPQFDGWPRWDSVTHQTVHEDWLQAAWRGGLRLMIMLAVNNEWMCSLPGFELAPGRSGRDMEAVDLQLEAALAMERDIDAKSGGAGQGWYRIVRSAQEAAAVIATGKLAVVLGIEVDYPFGSYLVGAPTPQDVQLRVQRYFDRGVRYVFPIHFADNAFGGTALQNAMGAADVGVDIPLWPGVDVHTPYVLHTTDARALGYRLDGGRRNTRGLSPLGRVLITELINRGMLFDVDHMSWQTRADVLAMAEQARYPVISGHSGFIDVCHVHPDGNKRRHEGQQTGAEVDRIRALGGMVAPIIAQGDITQIATYNRPDGTSVEHVCGGTANSFAQAFLYAVQRMDGGPVGLGTDLNGFAGLPGPTAGPESCPGGKSGAGHVTHVVYPFTSPISGQQVTRSVIGQKPFDIGADGLAHVGMLPDFIEGLRVMGVRDQELAPLLRSAPAFTDLWARTRQTWQTAFQANSTSLWTRGHDVTGQDLQLGMAAGTSPAIAEIREGGQLFAFQANTGTLWVVGADNRGDMHLGMKASTSPAAHAMHGGWQVAFQANTTNLWVVGTVDERGDMGLGMRDLTSPSIAAVDSGWQVAFQANTGNLWVVGTVDQRGDMGLGMMAETSPCIAAVRGGWVVAFQANTGNLWVVGKDAPGDTGLGMRAGTGPSVVGVPGGGWQAAFQANTGNLWVVGVDSRNDTGLGMKDRTSPSICMARDHWQVAFQANTGNLWVVGADNPGDLVLGMHETSSPAITAVATS